jgi:hypothetical protein
MKKMVVTNKYTKKNPLVWKRMRNDSLLLVNIIDCISLYKNIMIIQDSITKDVILLAPLISFPELEKLLEDFKTMKKLSTKLIKVLKHASPVINNKAHQNRGGLSCIFVLGWRAEFNKEFYYKSMCLKT